MISGSGWHAGRATVTTWVDPSLFKAQEAEYMIEKASEKLSENM
jgi:hypothetical protein